MNKVLLAAVSVGLAGILAACGPESQVNTRMHPAPTGLLPRAGASVGTVIGEEQYGKVTVVPSTEEVEVMRLVNEVRTRGTVDGDASVREGKGSCIPGNAWQPVKPLDYSGVLALAARNHAQYAAYNTFNYNPEAFAKDGHNETNMTSKYFTGFTIQDRIKKAADDVSGLYPTAQQGEIVAAGHLTPRDSVIDWIHSPGHCTTMMRSDLTHMGAGMVDNPTAPSNIIAPGWVVDFGTYYTF